MAQYTVGEYIKEWREKKGISQEKLSEGICAPSSLSKIETGVQMPSRAVYEALMQRLGRDETLFSSFSSKKEMEKQELMQKLARKMTYKEYDDIWEVYQELAGHISEEDNLGQQYLLYTKEIINQDLGNAGDIDAAIQHLIEALHTTRVDFDVENPPESKLLTFAEIMIINNIAILYRKKENYTVALRLLFYLKEYMETHLVDEKEKGGHYPLVLLNLSRWLAMVERTEEALEVAELGIDACIQYGKMSIFPNLLLSKGNALLTLHSEQEAIDTYRQTYYVLLAMKKYKRAEKVKEFFEENNYLL